MCLPDSYRERFKNETETLPGFNKFFPLSGNKRGYWPFKTGSLPFDPVNNEK